MSAPNEQTQTYTKSRDIIDIGKQVGIDLEVQADTLLDEAREADSEQSSLIDTSPLDYQYNAALADANIAFQFYSEFFQLSH